MNAKLKQYIEEEKILEFSSDQECMDYFNTYDFQNFKTIEDMKKYQDKYGFNIGTKRYHINTDDALDILDSLPNDVCYTCLRKTECYSQYGLEKLDTDKTFREMSGYGCGALYKSFEEAQVFISNIGKAIETLDKKTQNKIIKHLSKTYNTEESIVRQELFDLE